MSDRIRFDTNIATAIQRADCASLERLIRANPTHVNARTPFGGGTWLHYAAGHGHIDVARTLIELGFDVNQPGYMEGDLALCNAAGGGHVGMIHFLLDHGSKVDTSASVRNALFAAIVGQSCEVVRTLLDRGLDASVRYNSDTMIDMDATAFALWRGESKIACIIAMRLADGDPAYANALLHRAADVAKRNAPLDWMRIVPSIEDFQ